MKFYKARGIEEEEFAKMWLEIGRLVKLDPTPLRPDDTWMMFVRARPSWYEAEDECDDLVVPLISRCRRAGLNIPEESFATVDGCVLAMWECRRRGAWPKNS